MKKIIFKYLMSKQWFLHLVRQRFNEEMEYVQFNNHAEGCGLEDRNITDRYEAMEHGWEQGVKAVEEAFSNVA
jgi:hypothetical protein